MVLSGSVAGVPTTSPSTWWSSATAAKCCARMLSI